MKKKVLCTLLAAAMLVGTVTPVLAESNMGTVTESSDSKSQEAELSYEEGNKYTLSIPIKIELKKDQTVTQSITASFMNIAPNYTLDVTISDGLTEDGKVTLVRSNSQDTTTSVVRLGTAEDTVTSDTVVARFAGTSTDAETGTGTLNFLALAPNAKAGTEDILLAGSYTGTMTFQVAVNGVEN